MADSILTSERPSSSSTLNPPSRIICHVCQKQFSQYTCPRCNSRYCTLQCYKTHSLRCTESFMRENVEEELRQMQPDDQTKRRMLDILKRFHSEEETGSMDEEEGEGEEEGDSTLSEEIIQKISSGGQISFDDLSVEEKKRFQRAIASGELSKMIEPWDPWWLKPSARTISLSKDGTQLVQPLAKQESMPSPQDDLENDQSSEIPRGPETPLPPVSRVCSSEPSPLLAIHLVDIIYSYCFTLRLYNGDWQSDALGSSMVVLSVSSVLGQGRQPESVLEALSHCLEQTCSSAFKHMGGSQFAFGLIDDVISLLSLGGCALICSLCDLQRLIRAGKKELQSEKPKKSRSGEIKSKLKFAERKIYFIVCWVHEQPGEAWSSLANIIRAEKASAMEYSGGKSPVKMEEKPQRRCKLVIEEMK
ncbi:HIT-type Zinc finger family protein [Tripterygium wilfordii]|uniref:HIT-type Zinc finger family protein n=1 Tax=Tripterygium wilfordii TaxID=458696 RepID=A0A7J7CLM0_TRIWF|nr:zinc finger HIT domain-containing protein 2 [Tripterygium wilfordii]KAF5734960.1 HIT-type Zinc finger family protein [Tripterygium wilfordii]